MTSIRLTRACVSSLLLLALSSAPVAAQVTWRVDPQAAPGGDGLSWATAFHKLQNALDAANTTPGRDEVWIAGGVHIPTFQQYAADPHSRHFLVTEAVELYGGFDGTETQRSQRDPAANPTILDGDRSQDDAGNFQSRGDNVWVVMYFNTAADAFNSLLDGLTIKGGHNFNSPLFPDAGGGAQFNGSGHLVIRDCTFIENLGGDGGALSVDAHNFGAFGDSTLVLEDCRFERNIALSSGGAFLLDADNEFQSVIDGCLFRDNQAAGNGGAAQVVGPYSVTETATTCVVRDCTFEGNRADGNSGGALVAGRRVLIESCRFRDNQVAPAPVGAQESYGGAILASGGDSDLVSVHQCLFVDNVANHGGAVAVGGIGSCEFRNCTLYGNHGRETGGALFLGDVETTVASNSILWGNTASASPAIDATLIQILGQQLDLLFCDVQGGFAGLGTFSSDPRFVDADGPDDILGTADDDFSLTPWSPCVDSGSSAHVPFTLFLDISGASRIQGTEVDMGVSERSGSTNGRPLCASSIDAAPCPCGNFGMDGSGCSNSVGVGVLLTATGDPVVASDTVVLHASGGPSNRPGMIVQGTAYSATPLKDGVLCAAGSTDRLEVIFFDSTGRLQSSSSLAATGQASVGQTRIYQLWYRNPGGPCATGSNFSNGIEVDWR